MTDSHDPNRLSLPLARKPICSSPGSSNLVLAKVTLNLGPVGVQRPYQPCKDVSGVGAFRKLCSCDRVRLVFSAYVHQGINEAIALQSAKDWR